MKDKSYHDREEQYIQQVLQIAPFAAFKADMAGNVLFMNQEWENIAGIPVDRSLGSGWLNALVKEDIPKVVGILKEAVTLHKHKLAFQYRVKHPDKGIRHFNTDVNLLLDEQGKGLYFIGYIQDITEEHVAHENYLHAERRQRELTLFLESLIASIDDIIFEIDGNKRFKNVWVKDEKSLFVPKEDVIGRTTQEVLGSFGTLLSTPIDKAIKRNETEEFEYRHIDPNIERWYTAKVIPIRIDAHKENYRLALIIQDTTNKVKQERSLKGTKELLERTNQMLESSQKLSNTGGWEYDIESGNVRWTQQMYAIYGVPEGYDASSLENNLAFYSDKYKTKIVRTLKRSVRQKQPYAVEAQIKSGDKKIKWVRLYGIPSVIDGRVISMHGALMDITKQKQDAIELLNAKNRAEQAAQSKTDFLSVMSHEIRTPLNGIIGITNLLKLSNQKSQEEHIDNLIFSTDYLLQLINNILDLNKIDSNNTELMQHEFNLFELLANMTDQFRSLANAKAIDFTCTIDPKIPKHIIGDATRLSQILYNLISNALKYTEEGQVVLTATETLRENQTTTIHFSIQDSGIGIPKEYHSAVFDSFKQVQQSAHVNHTGTGLGLAITKKLIELHNSRIHMESAPNKGTTFTFDLTFRLTDDKLPGQPTNATVPVTTHENKLGALRVLLVEDNPINAIVAQKQLEYFGIAPHHASNGKEALELLEKNTYHVAFVDLHMPEIDGHTLAKRIDLQYPDVHIVISTADIMGDTKSKLANVKTYDTLNKPVVMEKMLVLLLNIAAAKNIR